MNLPEDESAWARRAHGGDKDAFNQLVQLYAPRIYGHLYRIVRNREEAEDLTQETFIRAYRFIGKYDPDRSFCTWLYTIATNVGLNGLRARSRRTRHIATTGDDLVDTEPSPDGNARDAAAASERAQQLNAAVDQLSPRDAMLVHLHYHEAMSLPEAAEVLEISHSAAKVALFRARKRLREILVDGHESR